MLDGSEYVMSSGFIMVGEHQGRASDPSRKRDGRGGNGFRSIVLCRTAAKGGIRLLLACGVCGGGYEFACCGEKVLSEIGDDR